MASWTGIFKNELGFFKEFLLKNPINSTQIIQELTDLRGWTVLIKIEILIMAGLIFLAGQRGQMESALVLVRGQAPTFLHFFFVIFEWLINLFSFSSRIIVIRQRTCDMDHTRWCSSS